MIVAIHQPNYLPWLGYFYKIAQSDVFIFLDDVQYSKNSYINRVRVLGPGGARWLTVPVSYKFGDPISKVRPAGPDWQSRHLDTLLNYYGSAPCFRVVWPRVRDLYQGVSSDDLASINRGLVQGVAAELEVSCRFEVSSRFSTESLTGDDRLVALVSAVDPRGAYLSGRGGATYQNQEKFEAAGLELRYADFDQPRYEQGGCTFTEGLSVLDAVFRLGWAGAADLIHEMTRR